jgi:hypothetical protein
MLAADQGIAAGLQVVGITRARQRRSFLWGKGDLIRVLDFRGA